MKLTCKICGGNQEFSFKEKVLGSYEAIFDYCPSCGLLRARSPSWLSEAYTSSIASTDTGLVMRNNIISRKLASLLFLTLQERGRGKYVDVAGGCGLLTRIMRDYGFDFYWLDKYSENLMARGFEYSVGYGECRGVTAIEVMEHLEDPLSFIRDALGLTKAKFYIFTTKLFSNKPPPPENWRYYSFETGQHITFYQKRTLSRIAERLGLSFYSQGGIHIFSSEAINQKLLEIAVGPFSYITCWWIRRIINTKVMTDHHQIVNKLLASFKH